jgi:hypothetical protein
MVLEENWQCRLPSRTSDQGLLDRAEYRGRARNSDRIYIFDQGTIVHEGTARALFCQSEDSGNVLLGRMPIDFSCRWTAG